MHGHAAARAWRWDSGSAEPPWSLVGDDGEQVAPHLGVVGVLLVERRHAAHIGREIGHGDELHALLGQGGAGREFTLFPEAAHQQRGVLAGLQEDLAVLFVQAFPQLGGNHQGLGRDHVLVQQHVFRQLVLAGGLVRDDVAFRAIDLAGAEALGHFLVGYDHRCGAQQLHHLDVRIHLLHPDAQPHQVFAAVDGLVGAVERAGAAVVPAQHDVAGRLELLREPVAHRAVQVAEHVRGVAEQEGQVERLQRRHRFRERAHVEFRGVDLAGLEHLHRLGLVAQRGIGEELDPVAALGAGLHLGGEALHRLGDGIAVGMDVPGPQRRGGLAGGGPCPERQHGGECCPETLAHVFSPFSRKLVVAEAGCAGSRRVAIAQHSPGDSSVGASDFQAGTRRQNHSPAARGLALRMRCASSAVADGQRGRSIAHHDALAARIGAAQPHRLAMHVGAGDGLQPAGHVHLAHFGAARAQLLHGGGQEALFLQHGGAVEVAEVRQVDGLLRRQPPVEDAMQRLGGVVDDERAARAATAHRELAGGLVEDQGRGHGGAGALAGLHAVGDGPAGRVAGREAEVGQLVVQQEALDHLAGAELVLDGRRHRHGIAAGVHHADVAGAVLDLVGHRCQRRLHGPRRARLGHLQALRADEARALGQVGGIEQARPTARRRLHEIGVGHVEPAVGEGQARGLVVVVEPVGAGLQVLRAVRPGLQRHAGCGRLLQDAEDLRHGDRPGAGRRESAHAVGMGRHGVVAAQGFALLRLVARQVRQAQLAGIRRMALHLGHDGLGDLAFQQGLGTVLRDGPQHGREFRIAQHMPHGPGLARRIEEVGPRGRVLRQVFLVGEQAVEPGAHLEAALGQSDGGLEQLCPGQHSMLAVRHLQHAHGAGHADRAATDHAVVERHGLAVPAEEQVLAGGGRGGLAPVVRLHLAARGVQQEGAAADAAGLGFDQREHHLHRDGRIDGRPAGLEHLVARIGGQRIGRGDRELARGPSRLLRVPRRPLGLVRHRIGELRGGGAGGQQGRGGSQRQGGAAGGRELHAGTPPSSCNGMISG